jgi:putative Mn2+ efflux pump MntP
MGVDMAEINLKSFLKITIIFLVKKWATPLFGGSPYF